jgi:putative sterol carrier protein
MPTHFLPEQAGNIYATIQFHVTGQGGGDWYVDIANGALQVHTGQAPAPKLTVTASAADYLAIVNGDTKPMTAFMQGKVRVQGDMPLIMRLQSLFSFG